MHPANSAVLGRFGADASDDQLSDDFSENLCELYERFHEFPELSMQEHGTAEVIRTRMMDLGFEVFSCAPTGVVAVLRNGDGPVVAFRADMDGLPVRESTGVTFASTATGRLPDGAEVSVMHACGHDIHMTCAIGAATVLAGSKSEWSGTVEFIFQPAEETGEGALALLDDGLWERTPIPEIIYAQHVSTMAAGTVELASGVAMAIADNWKVTVHGKGGHGSQPETAIDPVLLAAHMIVRLQSVVAREIGAHEAAVVTVATIHAGTTGNVIPSHAEFTINMRCLDRGVRQRLHAALRRALDGEALASGAPLPEIEEQRGFPQLYNDPTASTDLLRSLRAVLDPERVVKRSPLMGSEDFGHLGAAIGAPSVYWMLGGMSEEAVSGDSPVPANHSPYFIPVLEPTLSTGVIAAVTAIRSRLRPAGPATRESDQNQ